jgi:hypothetical protein
LLKIGWDYPTYAPAQKDSSGDTAARSLRHAIASDNVFKVLAGNDPRPLLVLRECDVCNGTDDALLSKGADNERTFLMSTWFHCVKLPVDVLKQDHPFYELFGHDDPEHLFVSMPDGSLKVKLESQTSRTELWDAMGQVLAAAYKTDPQPVVKLVQKALDRMDVLDEKLLDLRTRRNELLETEGASSKKLAKIDLEIAQADQEIVATKTEIAKATKLELKNAPASAAGAAPLKADR